MDYERFYEYRTCPKCGSDRRKVEHHPKQPHMIYEGSVDCMAANFDHMVATCERCGYAVVELPLDAEA
jgi:predicted nucleic-acid-binding Zn-ribbon protein